MPVYAAKAGGFFFIVFGFLAVGRPGADQRDWVYGLYDPPVTAGSSRTGTWASPMVPLRLTARLAEFHASAFPSA